MIKCCLTAWYNVSDRGQGEVILLAQVDCGIGQGKGADLKKQLVKWQLGLDHGADFYEGNLVDILTMCKEEE